LRLKIYGSLGERDIAGTRPYRTYLELIGTGMPSFTDPFCTFSTKMSSAFFPETYGVRAL
jgi:hypothetical protein